MDKYLIVGLGNPGDEYAKNPPQHWIHDIGRLRKSVQYCFEDKRYGYVAETSLKDGNYSSSKPTTYMNLSGNAVRYWLNKENIDQQRLLVISDDVALPLGAFRLKAKGSNGGHNGLGHIQQLIGQDYPRLRVGIGNDFQQGRQIDWVLGEFGEEDLKTFQPTRPSSVDIIKRLCPGGHRHHHEPIQQIRKEMNEARIDKWLWAARIFKTRSIAVDAIKNGRVTIGGMNVKPSRPIKVGEVVSVKKPPITYSFRVLQAIEQRVGAKLVPEIYENVTDPKQYELLEMSRISGFIDRSRGMGRPTKKERRALD
jgi:Peptidyl-tRNA hydrolase